MTVEQLIRRGELRRVRADPAAARVELDTARRHVVSAATLTDSDPVLAFQALYDAARKAISAHMRAAGVAVTKGPGAHARTGRYGLAALGGLGVDDAIDEFDALRATRNQLEYDALSVDPNEVRRSIATVERLVAVIDRQLST